MLEKTKILKNSIIYFFANAVNAAVPFALLPMLTRYLTPAEYGAVAMFQTSLGLMSAFVGLSASGAATRKYYDNKSQLEYADFMGACAQIILLSSIFLSIPIVIFEDYITEYLGISRDLIFCALLLSAMNATIQLRLAQWQIRDKAKSFFYLLLSQAGVNFSSSLILIVIMSFGAYGRIFGQVITGVVFCIFSLYLLKKECLLNLSAISSRYFMEIVSFGLPLIPHMSSAFLLGAVDRVIVNRELGAYQVGVYMVAVQLAAVFGIIFDSINKAFVPWLFEKLSRNSISELNDIIRWTYMSFVALTLLAAISFFIAPVIVVFIAGHKYAGAEKAIGFLVLGQIFVGMYYLVTNYIFYSKKTIVLSSLSISAGLLNLGLLLMLVPGYGIKGAAVSFAISSFVQFVFAWFAAYKLHPMPWFSHEVFSGFKFCSLRRR